MRKKVDSMWKESFSKNLTEQHGVEVELLVKKFEKFRRSEIDVEELKFEAKAVREFTWEKLNVGKWSEVPEEHKQVYAIACFIQIVAILHENEPEALEKCIEIADLGILLGCPFETLSLTQVADILSPTVNKPPSKQSLKEAQTDTEPPPKRPKLINEIKTVSRPSLESFRNNYFERHQPVKLTDCIDHWPALRLWKDLEYLVTKAGHRTVPIELGKHYADGSYSQKLMKVADFVREFFREDAEEVGYLAQHQLFDQVPELKEDIMEPDYCAVSDSSDSSETEINAWFGPKGTVSPLHFDPKHNLLCQVVGSKKIVLYPPTDTPHLYPHDNFLLFNTSRVDVENPDLSAFPDFVKANREECLLDPGQILYIPPKYWHHVRSLENSFSVSFWWE